MNCSEIDNLSKQLYCCLNSSSYDSAMERFWMAMAHLDDFVNAMFGGHCRVELISDTGDGLFKEEEI